MNKWKKSLRNPEIFGLDQLVQDQYIHVKWYFILKKGGISGPCTALKARASSLLIAEGG